jgi:hypothetical protein
LRSGARSPPSAVLSRATVALKPPEIAQIIVVEVNPGCTRELLEPDRVKLGKRIRKEVERCGQP